MFPSRRLKPSKSAIHQYKHSGDIPSKYCNLIKYSTPVFLTGVPWNLRVLQVVSKGSAGPPVLSKKLNCVRHLRPLDAFSRLLVGPKCIFVRGFARIPLRELTVLPETPCLMGGACYALPKHPFPLSAFGLKFLLFGPQESPQNMPLGSVSNQNCCKGFHFIEKFEKHCSSLSDKLHSSENCRDWNDSVCICSFQLVICVSKQAYK